MKQKRLIAYYLFVVNLVFFPNLASSQSEFSRMLEIPFPETSVNTGGAGNMISGVDLDGDGMSEIYVVNDNWSDTPDELIPRIYKLEWDGTDWTVVWQAVAPVAAQNTWPPLVLADLDQDGKTELIWAVVNNFASEANPARIVVYEEAGDGSDVMGVSDGSGGYNPNSTWTIIAADNVNLRPMDMDVADVDNDGVDEIIFADRKGNNGGYYFGVASVDDIPDDAAGTETWTLETSGLDFTLSSNIENKWDVAVVDSNLYFFSETEISKLAWDGTQWSYTALAPMVGGSSNQASQVVDLDGDGVKEIITAIYDWGDDSQKGVLLLQEDGDTLIHTMLVNASAYFSSGSRGLWGSDAGDIDRDGYLDFVFGSRAGDANAQIFRLAYRGGDITSPASYDFSVIDSEYASEGGVWSLINITNIDGDPELEVLYTSSTDAGGMFGGTQPIVVLDYDYTLAPTMAADWEFNTAVHLTEVDSMFAVDYSGNSRTAIAGMDMDQDNKGEVILTDYVGRRVVVFEYDETNGVFDVVWISPEDTASHRANHPRTVGVGDLDNDDRQEIVFPLASTGREGWWVFEWDGIVGSDNYGTTYSSINAVEIDTSHGSDGAGFRGDHERITIFDVDGDGQQELIISTRRGSPRGTLITSVQGDIEHNAGGTGFETWSSEFFISRTDYGGGSPYHSLPVDLDGDGTYEIVNHTWNNFNFYNIDVTGANSYAVADPASGTAYFKATAADHVSLFGGGAGDVDGDGTEEAFFPNYYTGDLWVVDYNREDDVLAIDGDHVVKIVEDAGNFYASVWDVDQNDRPNIFVGHAYPRTITSTELVGTDPRNPADYETTVIYTGEHDVLRNTTIVDSGGVVTTSYSHTGAFASKVQSEWNGDGIDFDGDGNYELVASFQSNQDSITTTTYAWSGSAWDTTVTKVLNEKSWAMMLFEFTGGGVSVDELVFITPNDYKLLPNYPNPFNPLTNIEYVLPINKRVSIKIYNILGQQVRTLVDNEMQPAGHYKVQWNSRNNAGVAVASGVYIVSLEWGNFRKTHRMLLVK